MPIWFVLQVWDYPGRPDAKFNKREEHSLHPEEEEEEGV